MSAVFDYIYSLALAAATAGVLSLITPSKGKAVGKVIQYSIALAVILAVLAPVSEITDAVRNFDASEAADVFEFSDEYIAYTESTWDYIINSGIDNIEEKLRDILSLRFSVSRENFEVKIYLSSEGDITLDRVDVVLGFGAFGVSVAEVEEYIAEICGCEVGATYK